MLPIGTGPSIDHVTGALGFLFLIILGNFADHVVQSLFDRKIFEPIWSGARRKYRARRSKREIIIAHHEFSVYLDANSSCNSPRRFASELIDSVKERGDGDFELTEQKWSDDNQEVDIEVRYRDSSPYRVTLNFISGTGAPMSAEHNAGPEADIECVGVDISFRFAFGKLQNSMNDLTLFTDFLQKSLSELAPIQSVTNSRFVIQPIDPDLDLDDWIHEEPLDVTLLLESEDGGGSIKFYGDKAVIDSPHTGVDDRTVEYIRATLLNYYL